MLKKLNKIAKKYQPLVNASAIFLAIPGIYFTFFQTIQTNTELSRGLYQFSGEQFPTVKFETLKEDFGIVKVSIIQPDMLFQSCRVTYHSSLLNGHQEMIGMHDSIWYNTAVFTFFKLDKNINVKFQNMMKNHDFNSYMNLRTPVLLEFNYVKYGESRVVSGLFNLEFSYYKNFRNDSQKLESEMRAIYFNKYLSPKQVGKEELNKLKVFELINGA